MFTIPRIVAVGVAFFLLGLLTLPEHPGNMASDARSGETRPANEFGAALDSYQVFQKAAIEYAISKQKESEFQLSPNEYLTYGELRKKLMAPIEKERSDYRAWIEQNAPFDYFKLWPEFIKKQDAAIYKAFKDYFETGQHSEASVYFYALSVDTPLLKQASKEAYEAYIDTYRFCLDTLPLAEKGWCEDPWTCKSHDGKSFQTMKLLPDGGVRPVRPGSDVKFLAHQDKFSWPWFPPLELAFRLGDENPGLKRQYLELDFRHMDRTNGDRLREGLIWLTSDRGAKYYSDLNSDGHAAALASFADSLMVESIKHEINFIDKDTKRVFLLQRSTSGTLYTVIRRDFMNRCTAGAAEKPAPIVVPPTILPRVADVTLSNAKPHAETRLRPGGTLKVNVSLSAGTGYKLHLVPPTASAATLTTGPVVSSPLSKKLGAPSMHYFEFRIADTAPADFRIVFQLRRPGQTTGLEYDVTVHVLRELRKR